MEQPIEQLCREMFWYIAYDFISLRHRNMRPSTLTIGIEHANLKRHREMPLTLMIERQNHRHSTEIRQDILLRYVSRIGIDIIRAIVIDNLIRP